MFKVKINEFLDAIQTTGEGKSFIAIKLNVEMGWIWLRGYPDGKIIWIPAEYVNEDVENENFWVEVNVEVDELKGILEKWCAEGLKEVRVGIATKNRLFVRERLMGLISPKVYWATWRYLVLRGGKKREEWVSTWILTKVGWWVPSPWIVVGSEDIRRTALEMAAMLGETIDTVPINKEGEKKVQGLMALVEASKKRARADEIVQRLDRKEK